MHFRERFVILLALGITFSATVVVSDADIWAGAIVATVAVVLNYWLALILVQRTVGRLRKEPA